MFDGMRVEGEDCGSFKEVGPRVLQRHSSSWKDKVCGAGVPRSSFTFQFELSPAEGHFGVVVVVVWILPPSLP